MKSLPLGIDIGSTRVRIVHMESTLQGERVRAVAVRDLPGAGAAPPSDSQYLSALLEDALAEIGTSQRRCVCAIGEPEAVIRSVKLPQMTRVERERAARFEAMRVVEYPLEEAVIKIHPVEPAEGVWALGIARSSAIRTRMAALRGARLRPVAIDHEACALARALQGYDAIVDVGHQRTSVHVVTGHTPLTLQAYNGGADVTRAIERELSLDAGTAEKRKRILGTAGAGERARASLIADIAVLIESARKTRLISRMAIVGNAARLPGLSTSLESATGAVCEIAVSDALRSDGYSEDVVRSSAPDWTLAAGLALWGWN